MTRDEVIQKIQTSKSYKAINPKTIERIVDDAFRKNPEYAVNTAKNDLHKLWGAFYSRRPRFNKLLRKYKNVSFTNEQEKRAFVLELLQIHSSTSERIPIINNFYKKIFEITGIPSSILDVACGLNPLAIPLMGLPSGIKYYARDIDSEEVDFLNQISPTLFPEIDFKAEVKDVFEDGYIETDLTFMLKLVPLLEQQAKNSTLEILEKVKSKYLIVSFPTKTLSGKDVGMSKYYSEQFEVLIKESSWEFEKIEFYNELVYILKSSKS